MPTVTRRRFLGLAAALPASVVGCQGVPTIFGYKLGAGALYDPNISTIYVRTFQNRAFQTNPYRAFEVDITEAVVAEIGRVTPFRVVSKPEAADTELIGVVVAITKQNHNRTQQNTVRDGELQVSVDVVWRDLRDGKILSTPTKPRQPGSPIGQLPGDPPLVPFDPNVSVAPVTPEQPPLVPQRIFATGRYLIELGETNASAMARVQNRLAVQIVSMMERKW